jgi:hypothetical protein
VLQNLSGGPQLNLIKALPKSAKRQIELRGYRCDVGLDGFSD